MTRVTIITVSKRIDDKKVLRVSPGVHRALKLWAIQNDMELNDAADLAVTQFLGKPGGVRKDAGLIADDPNDPGPPDWPGRKDWFTKDLVPPEQRPAILHTGPVARQAGQALTGTMAGVRAAEAGKPAGDEPLIRRYRIVTSHGPLECSDEADGILRIVSGLTDVEGWMVQRIPKGPKTEWLCTGPEGQPWVCSGKETDLTEVKE